MLERNYTLHWHLPLKPTDQSTSYILLLTSYCQSMLEMDYTLQWEDQRLFQHPCFGALQVCDCVST